MVFINFSLRSEFDQGGFSLGGNRAAGEKILRFGIPKIVIPKGESPPQAENFGDFGTPKMRFLKGKTLKTGPKKVTKIVLIKTPQIQDLSRNYNNSPIKFINFGPIRSLRGGYY